MISTHLAQGADFQVRAVWKPRSVVLWDSKSSSSYHRCGMLLTYQIETLLIQPSVITIPPEMVSVTVHESRLKQRGRL
jgi:hypothetical protein